MRRRRPARPVHPMCPDSSQAGIMRVLRVALLCLFATALTVPAAAQDTAIVIYPDSAARPLEQRELPRIVAEEVVRLYNAETTTRLYGRTRLPRGNEWRGDVAVRGGPVLVAGRVQGTLVVVNGDLGFAGSAVVTGDVIVVGGTINGAPAARVGGALREYREALPYRMDGDQLVYAPSLRSRFPRVGAGASWGTADSRSTLMLATSGTFNRVEGLPIVFGPDFDLRLEEGLRLNVNALGIFRSAGDLSDARSDLGYLVRAELRTGERRTVGVGIRLFDIVSPVEDWGLRDAEVGWASFMFHRDYRDYFLSKGVAGRAFVQLERPLHLAFEVRREWQTSVTARDPWTIFRTSQPWRPNPPMDDGHYVTFATTLTLDTRNDDVDPTSGWLFRGHVEHSRSSDVAPRAGLPAGVRRPIPTDRPYAFQRVFIDVRRYTRISPAGRVNLRVVVGGWLGGDALPLQRRLSLGGPDPMAGYAFRHTGCNRDVIDADFAAALVALCDRALLVQGEYRGHVKLNWAYPTREGADKGRRSGSVIRLDGPDIVVFADGGQAWLVGNGPGRIASNRFPTIGTWLADVGLGIDWAGFGFYVAKAVTVGEPLRFTVRLDHRF